MYENRRSSNGLIKLSALLIGLSLNMASCAVFTVNKSELEEKLKSKSEHPNYKGISLKSVSLIRKGKPYNNIIDTLLCADEVGNPKVKRFNYTSTIRIITTNDKSVKLYAKSLYIWNDQFLVGERVSPSLYGPSFFPVKLSDIARIEVKP